MMTLNRYRASSDLTVQQFMDIFFVEFVEYIRKESCFVIRDAKKVVENAFNELKSRFKTNNSHPVQVFQEAITNIVSREINKYRRLMDKNFGLSEDSFAEMLVQLRKGNEQIYETVFLAHFNDCLSFVKRKYNASHQDAYDASMEAMLNFCQRLKEGKIQYGNLRFLFTQMAGQLYLKWLKKDKQTETIEGYDVAEESIVFDKESLAVLSKAWVKLGEGCQSLLKDFYHNGHSLKEIAAERDKKSAAIRKQKQRCIEKLRTFFIQIT